MLSRRNFVGGAVAGYARGSPPPDAVESSPERYFDLPGRAAAAVHCLTSLLDERQDQLPYFDVKYDAKPPAAVHIRWDYGDGVGRCLEALLLSRIMSGSDENPRAGAALERWLLRLLGEDGLSWWPESPYPVPHPSGQPGRMADVTWTQRSTLLALTTLHAATGDSRFADHGRRLVDGLSRLAMWNDGMASFPEESTRFRAGDVLYPPGGWKTRRVLTAGWFGAILGVLIVPLVRFARATGYEPAVRLARGLAEFVLHGSEVFHPDGRFRDLVQGHYYARATTGNGLLRLGVLTGERPYVEAAERIYRHAKEWGTPFGWFPEDLGTPGCETCCIKEMIEFAIGLAMQVDARYWEDAERFGRNHLLESQLLRTDWLERYQPAAPWTPPAVDPARISRDRVMERWRGGFAGWSGVNDWVFPGKGGMACCNASGARALYDLWRYGVTKRGRQVSVNLLFSRAAPDATVKSFLPFAGRVEIRRRSDDTIRLRIPASAAGASPRVEMNGVASPTRLDGAWLLLPSGKAGDRMSVEFPLLERVETVHLGYRSFDIHYRGETVVRVDPKGTVYPLYDRAWAAGPTPSLPEPFQATGREVESI